MVYNILMIRYVSFVASAVLATVLGLFSTGHGQDPPAFVGSGVTKQTNPHYTGKYCDECHLTPPKKGEDAGLRFSGDYVQLCRCHGYGSETYIHPVEIVPSAEKLAKIPKDFPLKDGRLTCATCHDIYKQCRENREFTGNRELEKKFHRIEIMFLRGEPSQKRTDICFKCHDEQQYRMLNPHVQVTESGNIIEGTCLYCHAEKPDVNRESFEEVKLIGSLMTICQRCHGTMERHPGNIDHYRVPSTKLFTRIKMLEQDFNVVLPFDYEGKITCITCHNPHDNGVIPAEKKGAKGADEKYRHRIPKLLCISCHKM